MAQLALWRRYLNAIQTTAQHLLRYLAVAVVVNKRRRNSLKDLVRVVEQVRAQSEIWCCGTNPWSCAALLPARATATSGQHPDVPCRNQLTMSITPDGLPSSAQVALCEAGAFSVLPCQILGCRCAVNQGRCSPDWLNGLWCRSHMSTQTPSHSFYKACM